MVVEDPYEAEQQKEAYLKKLEFILVKVLRVLAFIFTMVIKILVGVLKSLFSLVGIKFKS